MSDINQTKGKGIMPTVDDHLNEQARLQLSILATLTPVPNEPDLVAVHPWAPPAGCSCDVALRLRKADLELEPTSETTVCCGKRHAIVRVFVKPTATVPAADFLAHLQRTAGPVSPQMQGRCQKDCHDGYLGCMQSAKSDADRRDCDDSYGACIEDCRAPRWNLRKATTCDCNALNQTLERLQDELHDVPTGDKAAIIRAISRVLARIEACGC